MIWNIKQGVIKQKFETKVLALSAVAVLLSYTILQTVTPFMTQAFAATITDRVVINEIFPSPSSDSESSEWIELYNPTTSDVPLDGWTIKDGVSYSKSLSGVIQPNSFATFEVNNFNNDGDTAILSNGVNSVDTVTYDEIIPNNKSYARTYDASDEFAVRASDAVTEDSSNGAAPVVVETPSIETEEFVTNDGRYKGISVGFWAKDFVGAKSVTVTIERENADDVTKTAAQGVLDLINDDGTEQLSTPFVIQQGDYNEADDTSYWSLPSTTNWTKESRPTRAIITIVNGNDEPFTKEITPLTEANGWTYESLVPLAPEPAPTTTVVRSENTQGWAVTYEQSGGEVDFVADSSAPNRNGALSLKTTADAASKATYTKTEPVALSDLRTLSYSTKQISSPNFPGGLPSYQLGACLDGLTGPNPEDCLGYASLVYEPYVSEGNTAVQNGVWKEWAVSEGEFYSTRTIGTLQKSQGSSTYTLDYIKNEFPNADIFSVSVNVGSNNPNYDTLVDNVRFNNVIYDFENTAVDSSAPTITDITVSPLQNGNTGGTVTISATIDDPSGVNLSSSKTHVRFSNGPNTSGAASRSANKGLTLVDGTTNRYSATFDTKEFVKNGNTGTYWIYFRLEDGRGNAVGNDSTRNVFVDNKAPVISNVGVDNPTSGSAEVRVKITDPSGLNLNGSKTHVRFMRGTDTDGTKAKSANMNLTKVEGTNDEYVATFDTEQFVSNGYAGTYWLYFRVEDNLGNAVGNDDTRGIVVDNSAPSVSLSSPASNAFVNGTSLTQSWSSTDTDISHYVYESYNDEAMMDQRWSENMGTKTSKTAANVADAVFWWRVKAVDRAGNESWSELRKLTVDNAAPQLTISSPNANETLGVSTTDNKLNIDGTVDDDNFRYYYCYVTIAGGGEVGIRGDLCQTAWAEGTPSKTAFSQTPRGTTGGLLGSIDLSGVENGNYTVHLVAFDKAGNQSRTSTDFVLENIPTEPEDDDATNEVPEDHKPPIDNTGTDGNQGGADNTGIGGGPQTDSGSVAGATDARTTSQSLAVTSLDFSRSSGALGFNSLSRGVAAQEQSPQVLADQDTRSSGSSEENVINLTADDGSETAEGASATAEFLGAAWYWWALLVAAILGATTFLVYRKAEQK